MKRLFNTDAVVRRFVSILAIPTLGVAVTVGVWYLTAASEYRAYVQEFTGRADNQAIILQERVNDYFDNFYAVRALFDSSDQTITRDVFERFSNSILTGRPAILNMAWIPRVRREERVAHELAAARDGIPNYHIRTFAPDGSLPISPERDEYFPKFYSTETRTSPVYGLDLNDGGLRGRTLNHIRDGNVLSVSSPLLLQIGQGDRRGFWAGLPVYARGLPHETPEDRHRNLIGIVQGVFQVQIMIDAAFSNLKSPVHQYLFVACTRFRRHQVRCFNGTGGASWNVGSSRGSSSLRLYG